ncbi:phage antirepressor KilAC domain-containing protein [Bacillus sp. L381]|uniref:phage antirepressor KilAC domain-containing protein n=1 Tax=Bacillus TaxID=1386 RepID=UPI001BA71C45|nr:MULTISPECIES: phage antirepressor KilAC domain-containing protein [Bacillus]MCR9038570.1 phage antirepressor KilAC domain-containing protein [Bacillus velezensis]QUN07921.1 phage antirepressor KilAC domain-containing protein [Bacillus amyloliquefaciens]QYM83235.1 phage antirepressor KilAC domain-containing protein [Bacillus sp. 7D3]QZY10134.1 phage antirepressor KilAC domain-containing protein [Bacillus amyloliquefaciens]WIX20033.1 phage antirepressor KilAC domain-containing protein [Bacill
MNQVQTFRNGIFQVEAKIEDDQILFNVEQVAKSLGFTQTKNNKEYIRWETINRYLNKYLSQEVGKGDFIPESLVYKLAFKASNQIAEQFQDWLAIEVIPTIRKTGGYVANDEQFIQTYLSHVDEHTKLLFKTTLHTLKEQNKQIESMKPKALFAEAVEASESSVLVGELAKIIQQNGVKIGPNKLFQWLRDNGYLIRKTGESFNLPTQRSMDMGLFEIKKRTMNNPDGSIRTTRTPKVTGKGQIYFVNKFISSETA